jgi:hypothetical protein
MEPGLRAGSRVFLVLAAAMTPIFGTVPAAHRYDELLQAARIDVQPDRVRVEMMVTPGIAVADSVLLDIDADHDGTLSSREQEAYAERLGSRISLRVDGSTPLPIVLAGSTFPTSAAMRTGDSAIVMQFAAPLAPLRDGEHRLTFRNENPAAGGVYLANVLVPHNRSIAVTRQERDVDQRELTVAFASRGAAVAQDGYWIGVAGVLLLLVWMVARASGRKIVVASGL